MSVPFDVLGPGQKGRLVYQVLGQNGPISNPSNIRYLSPDQLGTTTVSQGGVPGLDMALAAGQVASLGLGMANLGMSLAIMKRLGEMDERLKSLESGVDRLEETADLILEKVTRIDIATAEQNLRSSLRHVLAQSIDGDSVDLNQLHLVESDLERFVDSLSPQEIHYGLHPGLRFSSDVRDMLSAVYHFLRGARHHMVAAYNRLAQGSPVLSVTDDNIFAELRPSASCIVANLVVMQFVVDAEEPLIAQIEANSVFGNSWAQEVIRQFFSAEYLPREFDSALYFSGAKENLVADTIRSRVSVPNLGDSDELVASGLQEARTLVQTYLAYWWTSDAALLFKLLVEFGIRSRTNFWPSLERSAQELGKSNQPNELPPVEFNTEIAEREILLA